VSQHRLIGSELYTSQRCVGTPTQAYACSGLEACIVAVAEATCTLLHAPLTPTPRRGPDVLCHGGAWPPFGPANATKGARPDYMRGRQQ
jgi:hypothetical protein